jgi:hypothetical protein
MQITASSGLKEWKLPDPDTYPARCIRIIDLGTHKNLQFGTESRKAKFVFELIGTSNIFKYDQPAQPFLVNKEYSQSLSEKSNLRKDCESWMGRSLTTEELNAFDLDLFLGKPAFVQVKHTISASKKTYANVGTIQQPPKSIAIGNALNQVFSFEIGKPGWKEIFPTLWESDQKKIAESPEYKAAMI